MNPQKLISLSVQNFMRVSAVNIEFSPEGEVVVLSGDNEQGKSSVIKSVEYLLNGKQSDIVRPIHDGANEAKVCATLTDYVVTKTTSAAGTTGLKVTTRDRKPVSSPQTLLNGFVTSLSFDPMQFHLMATKNPVLAVETLKKLAGLDFTKLDAKRQELYNERTEANRTLAQSKAKVAGLKHDPTAPKQEILTSDLVSELQAARKKNSDNQKVRSDLEKYNIAMAAVVERITERVSEINELKAKIEALEKENDGARHDLAAADAAARTLAKEVSALIDADEKDITSRMVNADATNAKVRANKRLADLTQDIEVDQKTSDDLTAEIEAIDAEKERLLTNAKFPVAGISFNDSGVVLGGIPWAQCSTAQRLKATTAIGIALNPGLRAILIREGGNDLDKKSMAIMCQIAKEADVHVLIERVHVGAAGVGCSEIVIEDGHVKP